MGELHTIEKIATLCPHCGSKNIESDSQWERLDGNANTHNYVAAITLDYEGNDYFLHFFK